MSEWATDGDCSGAAVLRGQHPGKLHKFVARASASEPAVWSPKREQTRGSGRHSATRLRSASYAGRTLG